MKILIAEDDCDNAHILEFILSQSGYIVETAKNGKEALAWLTSNRCNALLTDWMMPEMDGMELIRRVRALIKPLPLIIMVTAIDSPQGRNFALDAGADDYITKPYSKQELLFRLGNGLERLRQPAPEIHPAPTPSDFNLPPFVGVVIASSSGGPPTLTKVLKDLPEDCDAAFFAVQHGPSWMLKAFAQRLGKETELKTVLAEDGTSPQCGKLYLAPGDRHLRLKFPSCDLDVTESPQENFVRPAADPLFRSAAALFGKYCVAVILTGMGRDGARGAAEIAAAGGMVLVQDPKTAVAASMPQTTISSGVAGKVVPLKNLAETIKEHVNLLSSELKQKIREKSLTPS